VTLPDAGAASIGGDEIWTSSAAWVLGGEPKKFYIVQNAILKNSFLLPFCSNF